MRQDYDGVAVGFPISYFYPLPSWLRHEKDREKIYAWVQPESFAIHHWHTSWW